MTFTNVFYGFTEIAILLLAGVLIRDIFKPIRKTFLPASVIGGVIGLILGPQFLNVIPIPDLFGQLAGPFGVIMMTSAVFGIELKLGKLKNSAKYTLMMFGTWGAQCVIGLALGELLRKWFDLPQGWGMLGVASFFGAHAIVPSVSTAYESVGAETAQAVMGLGMTISTIGMVVSFILGSILVNIAVRKGWTKYMQKPEQVPAYTLGGIMPEEKRESLGNTVTSEISINSVCMQFCWLLLAFGIGYGVIKIVLLKYFGISVLSNMPDLACGMIGAIILWPILKKIKLERYVDRRSSVQIANGCLDFMICGAVASIQLDIVADNLVAITVLCAVLTLFVTVYCLVVIRKTCREDWFEKAAILFGQNTGSTASGLTLLKMVDPEMGKYCFGGFWHLSEHTWTGYGNFNGSISSGDCIIRKYHSSNDRRDYCFCSSNDCSCVQHNQKSIKIWEGDYDVI